MAKDSRNALQSRSRPPSADPKQRCRVTNWSEYHASLRRRGSLTIEAHRYFNMDNLKELKKDHLRETA
jgi:hypothetical protein